MLYACRVCVCPVLNTECMLVGCVCVCVCVCVSCVEYLECTLVGCVCPVSLTDSSSSRCVEWEPATDVEPESTVLSRLNTTIADSHAHPNTGFVDVLPLPHSECTLVGCVCVL